MYFVQNVDICEAQSSVRMRMREKYHRIACTNQRNFKSKIAGADNVVNLDNIGKLTV